MSTPHQRSSSVSFPSAKRKRNITVSTTMPQTPAPLPAADDRAGWRAHWHAQGQPWRTEPAIDQQRQKELAQCRATAPDIEKGIYPFRGMKLSRADIEWLLATHEHGRGPVDWDDEKQHDRWGLDLRGTDLREANLENLPLARLRGGLTLDEWELVPSEHHEAAVLHLEGAKLPCAHLERAELGWAHLESTLLKETVLEGACLLLAHLEGANLTKANLKGANLRGTFFDIATDLDLVVLSSAQVSSTHWNNANLAVVKWSRVPVLGDEEIARQAKGQKGKKDKRTRLEEFERAVRANRRLTVVLRDHGLDEDAAHFAYRAQFLQRRVLWFLMTQSDMKLRQRLQTFGACFFSWFLFLIAGYGYKPGRSFLAYLFVISGFATTYYILGHIVGPLLSPLGALVFSMTSFHGRGFFPGNNISLDDPLTVLAALEALVGLIIEVTFIATLTQRFFNC